MSTTCIGQLRMPTSHEQGWMEISIAMSFSSRSTHPECRAEERNLNRQGTHVELLLCKWRAGR
jgi:hypothetical protein